MQMLQTLHTRRSRKRMPDIYKYGPLKSQYFSNFEKIQIEGFCKENNFSLSESNLTELLLMLRDKGPASIKVKSISLLTEASMFSNFAKDAFLQSWNRVLGFSMKRIQPKEALKESDIEGAKAASKWWLKEAPKKTSEIISSSLFNKIMEVCLMEDHTILNKLKNIDLKRDRELIVKIRPVAVLEGIDKTKGKTFTKYEGMSNLMEFEPALQFIPETENLINALAWTAENIKKLESIK